MRRVDCGFSLVELLVVISIIGLLAGLSSVAISKAMESGKKAKAKGDLTAIVAAVKAYKAEYGRFPSNAGPSDDEHIYASYATSQNKFSTQPYGKSSDLIAILCGQDRNGLNPKKIRFLEPGKMSDQYVWLDPWGKAEYCVMFDTNEDGGIEYWGDGNWEHPNIRMSVVAVSAGPNNTVDGGAENSSKCDDIFSWK
jgi:prepilin-type N-terminal cleavage/methylation domain-containing protein